MIRNVNLYNKEELKNWFSKIKGTKLIVTTLATAFIIGGAGCGKADDKGLLGLNSNKDVTATVSPSIVPTIDATPTVVVSTTITPTITEIPTVDSIVSVSPTIVPTAVATPTVGINTIIPEITETPKEDIIITPTVVASIKEEVVTPVATITNTPTPIIPESVVELDRDTVPFMAKYFAEKNATKGLNVEVKDLENALLIINNASIAREEMAAMLPSMDFMSVPADGNISVKDSSEIYMNAVGTHNIKNALYGKDINKYVYISDLSYNTTDSTIISALDEYCAWFMESINNGKFNKKQFEEAYYKMSRFCEGKSAIEINSTEYRYNDLTSGAKCTLERCLWPVFSTSCMLSEHLDQTILEDIQGVTTRDMNGSEYVNELYQYTTATPTPIEDNTKTK